MPDQFLGTREEDAKDPHAPLPKPENTVPDLNSRPMPENKVTDLRLWTDLSNNKYRAKNNARPMPEKSLVISSDNPLTQSKPENKMPDLFGIGARNARTKPENNLPDQSVISMDTEHSQLNRAET